MAITDLTGTTWLFNSSISGSQILSWNFTSNGQNFTMLAGGSSYQYDTTTVYKNGAWVAESWRTISITGGTDATNASAITWLQNNAVQQGVTPTTYYATSTEFTDVADAIRTVGGISTSLEWPNGFISAIENLSGGDGSVWITRDFTSTISNDTVSKIGYGAFALCRSLDEKTLNFPNVTTIEQYGFFSAYIGSSTILSFPKCTTIGSSAFQGATMWSANFPNVTSIYQYAFSGIYNLRNVSFPKCQYIGSYAFRGTLYLSSASFPECLNIQPGAFYGITTLSSLYFPKCTTIGSSAFYSGGMSAISFPAAFTIHPYAFGLCLKLADAQFINATQLGSSAFYNCQLLATTSFPLVQRIYPMAFYNCIALTTLSLPRAYNISGSAFARCYNLISLYLLGSSVATLAHSNAFSSTPIGGYSTSAGQFGSIYVPSSLFDSYRTATNWTYFASRFVSV